MGILPWGEFIFTNVFLYVRIGHLHSQNIIQFEKSRGESLVLKQFLMALGRVSIHMLSRRQKVHPEREYLAALLSPPAHYLTIFHKKITVRK